MKLAPILLFVYNRPWHTRHTLESLKSNKLAGESELFIFSDGPKDSSDEAKVAEVRTYIKSIDDFKKISIKESRTNKGLAKSVIDGVSDVLIEYDKVIVLEDDLISSPGFLKFMNEALDFYEDDKKIFSISGYSFQMKLPDNYKYQVFIHPRSSSWGWSTWSDRWESADWDVNDFNDFLNDRQLQKKFNNAGNDLTSMLILQKYGYINSWGIRWAYTHFKNNGYCLYPVVSQIKNIGTDRSGTNFKRHTRKYDVNISEVFSEIELVKDPVLDVRIVRQVNKYFNQSLIRKIINFFKLNAITHRVS